MPATCRTIPPCAASHQAHAPMMIAAPLPLIDTVSRPAPPAIRSAASRRSIRRRHRSAGLTSPAHRHRSRFPHSAQRLPASFNPASMRSLRTAIPSLIQTCATSQKPPDSIGTEFAFVGTESAVSSALPIRTRRYPFFFLMQVFVRDNNVDQALRILKKKMQREGVIREMKLRRAYEKPSERRTREKAEAIRRARKLARKKAQREGLIPMPKRREDVRRRVVRAPTF